MASPRPLSLPNRLAETLTGLGEALAENNLPRGLLRRADALHDAVAPDAAEAELRSGVRPLDALLSGGLRRGSFVELAGAPSSGRTSCAHAFLARVTERACAAWVDLADAFDPPSAAAGGVALERVLWARAPSPQVALRASERLLLSRAFELVVLDFDAHAGSRNTASSSRPTRDPKRARRRAGTRRAWTPPASAWMRLQRGASQSGCIFLLLCAAPLAGTLSSLALRAHPAEACFGESPAWLEGGVARFDCVRDRRHPDERSAAFPLALDPEVPPRARGLPAGPRSSRRGDTARAS